MYIYNLTDKKFFMANDVQATFAKYATFETFRYQLVVDKTMPMNAFGNYETPEQLRAEKNNIFKELITNEKFRFHSSNENIKSKLLYQNGDMYYFKVSSKRSARIFKEDFTENKIDNYPNIIVAINNHPDVQKIAIQSTGSPFKDVKTVQRFVLKTIDTKLRNYNLNFSLDPMFDKQDFWNFVRRHPQQITQLTFDLVSPNMSNISKNLTINLKEIYEDTNTHRTKVELNADTKRVLDIKEDSKIIGGLVSYCSDGGGVPYARIQNSRKLLNTSDNPSEFNVDEKLIKENDWEELDKHFKEILL